MIDDATIKKIALECGASLHGRGHGRPVAVHFEYLELYKFAKACYAAGQDAQRESDAKLCDRFAAREMHPSECASAIRTNKEP